LDIDVTEAAALFERADEQNVLENSTSETKRIGASGFTKMFGEPQDQFFENVLCTASKRGASRAFRWWGSARQAEFAVQARRENAGAVRAGREILAIEDGQTLCAPREKLSERVPELRLAVFAEPLQFVFVMLRTKADQFSDAGVKPTNGTGKRNRV